MTDCNLRKQNPSTLNVTKLSNSPRVISERVLVLATRGISHQHRHLMKDIEKLMPHSRHGNKMERKKNLFEVNDICALRNCNKCILFDGRLKRDLYMWISNVPNGPSVKFLVESIYTSGELKLTGNCLTGSRPLLSFDSNFVEFSHYNLLQELFIQIFGIPKNHPKSQPFIDHVITFSVLDNKIWYRNYQIINGDGAVAEIGPRFVLNPIKIFAGSFYGDTLWENPHYVTPARTRRILIDIKKDKYLRRKDQRIRRKKHDLRNPSTFADEHDIYEENTLHVAARLAKKRVK